MTVKQRLIEYLKVMRLWALTAAFVPVLIGSGLSWSQGRYDLPGFGLTMLAALLLQAGVNVRNTYDGYVSGVDECKNTYGENNSPLLQGRLSPISLQVLATLLFIFAALIGLVIVDRCGWPVLVCGIIGVIGGWCYTGGFWPYKNYGLGLLFVFFLMGPLMIVPSYFIQSGDYMSTLPWIVSLPISFLVTAIMQCNDIRDCEDDVKAGVTTIATLIGQRKSLLLLYVLMVCAFISLVLVIYWGYLSYVCLIPFVLLPCFTKIVSQYGKKDVSREEIVVLVHLVAKFHFVFGILLFLGIMFQRFL